MTLDPYSECPCGTGKKIKFCCPDLIAELDKAQRMIEGDQPRAALRHVEQALEKHPGRAPLLDLKTTLELSLGDLTEARNSVAEYMKVDPQNPSAHAQAAICDCSLRQAKSAVKHLQTAFELVADVMPARVLQAIASVGQALLVEGDMIAARAHLWLYQGIAGQRDSSAMELLLKLNQVSGLPLLLRDNLYMQEVPAGHEAEQAHDYAQMLASRGQWARAAAELDSLCRKWPEMPVIVYNHALVRGWLGESDRFVNGLREFVRLCKKDSTRWDDSVEAEAICQLLSPKLQEPSLEVIKTTFEVQDEDTLIDSLNRDPRTDSHSVNPSEYAAEDGPPPRCTFLLLDRPMPEAPSIDSDQQLSEEQVPRIYGILSYYGKQTDRERRLEYVADRSSRYDESVALLKEIAGETLSDSPSEEVVGKSAPDSVFETRWRFPLETPMPVRKELLTKQRQSATLELWPDKPLVALDGKSPANAKGDADLRVSLAAAVLNIEADLAQAVPAEIFQQLRDQLELPEPQPIDPQRVDMVMLPLVRLTRVDLSKVSDEELVALFERSELCGAGDASLQIAHEAIERPSLEEVLPKETLFSRLVTQETDSAKALEWINRARDYAESTEKSTAPWDIAELELRVVCGEIEEANGLVRHIRDEHLDEPGVADQLYRMLYSLGAIQPGQAPGPGAPGPGAPMAGAPPMPGAAAPPAAEADSGSKLWTPDSDPGASSGDKKIWTPT